jgi:hypothetical protein
MIFLYLFKKSLSSDPFPINNNNQESKFYESKNNKQNEMILRGQPIIKYRLFK